jgi:hypothetical protein
VGGGGTLRDAPVEDQERARHAIPQRLAEDAPVDATSEDGRVGAPRPIGRGLDQCRGHHVAEPLRGNDRADAEPVVSILKEL